MAVIFVFRRVVFKDAKRPVFMSKPLLVAIL